MHLLYTAVVLVFAAALLPWFLYQALVYRKYIGSLGERMGRLPISFNLDGDESIWIHAVSVGEALSARALIGDLRERYPSLRIYLSTTTLTGQQIARTASRDSTPSSSSPSTFRCSSTGRSGWSGPGSSS